MGCNRLLDAVRDHLRGVPGLQEIDDPYVGAVDFAVVLGDVWMQPRARDKGQLYWPGGGGGGGVGGEMAVRSQI